MAANPLTYQELEAFERKALIYLPAWETELLMRLDDEILSVFAEQQPKPTPKPTDEPEGIPVSDVKSIRGLFSRFARKPKT